MPIAGGLWAIQDAVRVRWRWCGAGLYKQRFGLVWCGGAKQRC